MEKPELLGSNFEWKNYCDPVIPPRKVVEEVRRTQRPVGWNNNKIADGISFPMRYRTRLVSGSRNVVVTHLLPGSCVPVEGWLERAPR